MATQIIDFVKFKQGKYKKREYMTCEECIEELLEMRNTATERQKNAINFSINLIVEFMKGVDDGK